MKKIIIFITIILFLSWVDVKSNEDSATGAKIRNALSEIHEALK